MIKQHLLVLIAVCAGYFAQAQVQSLGPTVGFNYAWMSDINDATGRPSFNIGLIYNYSILENIGLGVEARYSEEGVKQDIGRNTLTSKVNYARIPLEFNYFFGQLENDFRPKIFAGPSLAFLVGGKTEIRNGEVLTTVDSKDIFEKFDFGVHIGTGFNYRLAEMTWLNFDVAYTHGLTSVVQNNGGSDAKNRLVNVNLGIAFGF